MVPRPLLAQAKRIMKCKSAIMASGCFLALIIGLALAYPLLAADITAPKKVQGNVEVVYAYIGDLAADANVSGLWRNFSEPAGVVAVNGVRFSYDVHPLSYFIVLKITNPTASTVSLNILDLMVGPQISRDNETGSIAANNAVFIDHRETKMVLGWNQLWSPGESRLIYLSGVVGAHDLTYSALQNGSITIYVSTSGSMFSDQNAVFTGYDLKQVQLQTFGTNYLYNNLIGANQTLIFYSPLDVSIGLRQDS
jgi:hypothetical protein